jgi:hypothetical protein
LIDYKEFFVVDTRDEGQWSDPKVEPLWITATKQVEDFFVIFNFMLN